MVASHDEIVEYQEGNRIAMAYAQFTLMAASIFISASFTIFGLSFSISKPDTPWGVLMMGIISLMLYLINIIYDRRYTRITHQIIYPRLRDFEQNNMRMKFHTAIKEADDKWEETCYLNYSAVRIRTWIIIGGVTLFILWCFRISFWHLL